MTTTPSARTFSSDFKRFFIRGLVVLLPSVLTLWILVTAYKFVDNTIAEPINRGVRLAINNLAPHWGVFGPLLEPTNEAVDGELNQRLAAGAEVTRAQVHDELREAIRTDSARRRATIKTWWDRRWYLDLIGLIVAIVAVYIAGRLLGGFFGRRIYRKVEGVITTLPVFKQVYPYVKQVVDFLFSDEQPMKFNRVVVVEYPRKGIWSVGFLTGNTMKSIARESGDAVTVFIPSSPTPFTGYTITVPRREAIEVPITVEQAIRFAVTGGVLVPDNQLIPEGVTPQIPPPSEASRTEPLPLPKGHKTPEAASSADTEIQRDAG
ncbi:MAG: DUF502 domain-containing protein [Planctomycetes bacterium]|nr:DUF502 domain-containing protein [Planctomycetota bacterium]